MRPPTERQLQIARLIEQGNTYRQVGELLGISESGVKGAMRELKIKLGVESFRHVRPALREKGLI